MVGDGVKRRTRVGIGRCRNPIGAGTDVASESAGIVLVRIVVLADDCPRQSRAFTRHLQKKESQNLVWATAYNWSAIPIRGGLLVRWGI